MTRVTVQLIVSPETTEELLQFSDERVEAAKFSVTLLETPFSVAVTVAV